jgi:hypothetical protein
MMYLGKEVLYHVMSCMGFNHSIDILVSRRGDYKDTTVKKCETDSVMASCLLYLPMLVGQ